jgi:hypothetical protein
MKAVWEVDERSVQRWHELVKSNIGNDLAKERKRKNVERLGIELSRASLWKVFVGCQVTTQQKSGPGTPVQRFLDSKSIALDYDALCGKSALEVSIGRELYSAGLRRGPTIAANLNRILRTLQAGEWDTLFGYLDILDVTTSLYKEREVAAYLQSDIFPGLGPKQSRNFIQWVGLSRYAVPLDSRILKKLAEMECTFVPRSVTLSDESVYQFIEDGLQKIADLVGVYPCVLDACIFSSFDGL